LVHKILSLNEKHVLRTVGMKDIFCNIKELLNDKVNFVLRLFVINILSYCIVLLGYWALKILINK